VPHLKRSGKGEKEAVNPHKFWTIIETLTKIGTPEANGSSVHNSRLPPNVFSGNALARDVSYNFAGKQ